MGSKRRRQQAEHEFDSEPWPDASDLVDIGLEPIIAEGFTSGGFPYGQTLSEFRESMAIADRSRDWARAKSAMSRAVESLGLPAPEMGRGRRIGRGLSRKAFLAEVDAMAEGWPRDLVALVPRRNAPGKGASSVEREARLLRFLARQEVGFRVPDLAVAILDGDEAILVCEYVAGVPVDLRAGRAQSIVPWKLVGEIAASVHGLPVDELAWLGDCATRREHGERVVEELTDVEVSATSETREALQWLRENLPPDEPARLLHGDLLGHNLLSYPDRPVAVMDWVRAFIGDPAYDLAIVTRGIRRPFQVQGGLTKLLDAYAEHSDIELREAEVRFHEIALHLRWYWEAISGEEHGEPAPEVLARLRNLMRAV